MSSGAALVLFPDGSIHFGIYNGTSDILNPWLFNTPSEAWDHRRMKRGDPGVREWSEPPDGEVCDVLIHSMYGSGSTFPGRAARSVIIEPLDPWDACPEHMMKRDGEPDWVRNYWASVEAESA